MIITDGIIQTETDYYIGDPPPNASWSPYVTTSPYMNRITYYPTCPVCHGKTMVDKKTYPDTEQFSNELVSCRACRGRGIVVPGDG